MKKLGVYVDTSVFGGVKDEEFTEASRRFFGLVKKGVFTILISVQTIAELEEAPSEVGDVLTGLPPDHIEHVPVNDEVVALSDAYIESRILEDSSRGDAVHVAAATVAGADLVVSWNFKHIVRFDRIRKFNGVNAVKGYRELDIRSPLEIGHEEED